jgi:hypothetical protein
MNQRFEVDKRSEGIDMKNTKEEEKKIGNLSPGRE